MAYQDDIIHLLMSRQWIKGAGGQMYFPENAKPHLHAQIMAGQHNFQNLVQWFSFIVVSRPQGEGPNTDLVRDGQEVDGAIDDLGNGAIKNEAIAVCRNVPVPQ